MSLTLDDLDLQTPYLSLDEEFYDLCTPIPLEDPYLIHFNTEAAQLIDLDPSLRDDPRFVEWLNGTFSPNGSRPFSMCYAGHQFGNYAPRLGDGRAHNLGRINGWNLQTKGSGETLYARMADGRCALRSSIREYLMSEAMHYLGIPTTRALGIIGSKTKIIRNTIEYGAIVLRMSKSWVRFGTFEYFYYTGEHAKLQALTEYVISESYPHLIDDEDRFYQLFSEIVDRTAQLIAQWQGVGFNHGVMNTDNMSIAGLTLDYGPFAMMDDFKYGYICNHTDRAGRYSYAEQPNVSYWNLTMLSKALSPLISPERMQAKLDDYGAFIYPNAYINIMRKKMGLELALENDSDLIEKLIIMLHDVLVDYTLFFRTLSRYNGDRTPLFDIVMEPIVLDQWLDLYDERLSKESRSADERQRSMLTTNPKYVLKNYLLDKAIMHVHQGNYSMLETLLHLARHPFDELSEFDHYAQETPEEYKNIGLSCSS